MTSAGAVGIVVVAAGRGERLGPGQPKALRPLGGEPMLVHAVRAMGAAEGVAVVAVMVPPDAVSEVTELLRAQRFGPDIVVLAGGETRRESVLRGLASLPASVDVVLVHDAARPLAPTSLADAVVGAVRGGADAVVPGLAVADTVKEVDATELVTSTPDRSTLRAIQTPQGFRRATLEAAHAAVPADATDDAGLVERLGGRVLVVPGSDEAFKITRPLDLVLAEAVLAGRSAGDGG